MVALTYNTLERAGAFASAFSLLCERFCACVVAITYKHEKAIVGAYMRLYMWLCWSLADDDRRPAPRLRCGGPWSRMQQAGGQVLGGGVAEKAAASLGMGGEYSHTSPVAISHT